MSNSSDNCGTNSNRKLRYCLIRGVTEVEKVEEIVKQVIPSVRKGPMEGMVIVNGQPRMECSDMPTISFSEADLKRLAEYYQGK